MLTLPKDIKYIILSQLSLGSMLNFCVSCRANLCILADDKMWRLKLCQDYPEYYDGKPASKNFKEYYKFVAYDRVRLYWNKEGNEKEISRGVKRLVSRGWRFYYIDLYDNLFMYTSKGDPNGEYYSKFLRRNVKDVNDDIILTMDGGLYDREILISNNVRAMDTKLGITAFITMANDLYLNDKTVEFIAPNVEKCVVGCYTDLVHIYYITLSGELWELAPYITLTKPGDNAEILYSHRMIAKENVRDIAVTIDLMYIVDKDQKVYIYCDDNLIENNHFDGLRIQMIRGADEETEYINFINQNNDYCGLPDHRGPPKLLFKNVISLCMCNGDFIYIKNMISKI